MAADKWQLIQQGDKKAFEEVFNAFYKALCLFALPVIKDRDEAEEAVQTVFYNLWAKRETLQVAGELRPYLYRAVQNECLNRLKHRKVRAQYASDVKSLGANASRSSESMYLNKELGQKIHRAVDELPEQCGIVFKMNRFEELSYAEIAARQNISIKTVENHIGKALRLLREKLQDHLISLILFMMFF